MFVGILFSCDPVFANLTLAQKTCAEAIGLKFGVTRSKATHMSAGLMLPSLVGDDKTDVTLFRSLPGGFTWLASHTRPDTLNAVRAVCRYCRALPFAYWKAALHVLMYIPVTSGFGVTFKRGTVAEDLVS